MEKEIEKKNREILEAVKEKGLYPEIKVIEGGVPSEPEFVIDGKKVLAFCSANYLGLANDARVKKAIVEGLRRYGIHPANSPLISGSLEIHRRLERQIASFLGKEDAMIFNTSTMANMGVIPALVNLQFAAHLAHFFKIPFRKTDDAVLFSDQFNHTTMNEGCRLAKAEKVTYRHCDMNDLERNIKKFAEKKRKLILTDGVFSTNGRIAPLRDIVSLAKEYNAMVYVDDATATGFLGEDGCGTAKYFGVEKDVDIIITTFSKCFGIAGGVAAASKDTVDYLRITANTYVFSGAFSGALTMGILEALEIIKSDKVRRAKLWENTRYLKNKLQEAGFNTFNSETPIIPVLIGDEEIAVKMSDDLLDRGILSPPFRWPAMPKGKAIMRFTVTCEYSKEQMDKLVENLMEVGKEYRVIT